MRNRRLLGVVFTVAAAAAVAATSATALASPQPGHGSNYSRSAGPPAPYRPATSTTTVKHSFSLAASAFSPDGLHDTTQDYFNQWDPATLSDQAAGRCFQAGLALPNGITLKTIKAYYTQGSSALFFELSRQDLVNHTSTELVSYDTTVAASPVYTSTTSAIPAADAAVDYTKYAYTIGVCPVGTTTFTGITISYTQPAS